MLCDVWTLARNARKLAFHPWARGRTAVVGSLCDAPIGSSISSPVTSQHGSSLDGSLPSMLLAFCTASPGSLRRPAGPARTASGAMALLSTYLFDACRLSNLVAGGRPAWRAARWQPAQYALDSDFCLAALTAAASGAGASRLASPVLSTPATRVSARRPRRPRRARMARRSSGAFPAGCAGQSASLRAPPPLRGAATGAAAVNTAAVYVTIASLRRRSRRRRSPLAAALPCPALPSHKQTNTHPHQHTHIHTHIHTHKTHPAPTSSAPRLPPHALRLTPRVPRTPRAPRPLTSRLTPPSPPSQAFLLPAARRLLLPPHDRRLPVLRRLLPLRRQRLLPGDRRPRAYWNDPSGTRLRGGAPKGRHAWHVGLLGRSLTSPPLVHPA